MQAVSAFSSYCSRLVDAVWLSRSGGGGSRSKSTLIIEYNDMSSQVSFVVTNTAMMSSTYSTKLWCARIYALRVLRLVCIAYFKSKLFYV